MSQKFRGAYTDYEQEFYVRFVFSEAPVNIGILTFLESYDDEEELSAEDIIDAALRSAAQIGIAEECKEADEISIDDVVVEGGYKWKDLN